MSYAELSVAVDRLAARLAALGAAGASSSLAGARVTVVAPNVPALVVGMFAAWREGAVAVPLSARLREYELTEILRDAEPAAIVSVPAYRGYSLIDLVRRLGPRIPSLRGALFVDEMGEVADELAGPEERIEAELLDPEIGTILYTSGTTGRPKGVLCKHSRDIAAAEAFRALLELTAEDTCALVIPIAHAFGLTCLLSALAAGSRTVLVESTFSVAPLLSAVERHEATILHGSPALFISVLKSAPAGLPTVRTGFVAGASCPPGVIERLDELDSRILNLYGMTEISAASCCRLDDPPSVRYTTVGRPLPGFEWRIEESEAAERGGGELWVRGPWVTPGYFRRPEQTAEAFADGWFRTGDIGAFDEAGRLRITGRLKDVVHVGGFSVFPAEIEGFLLTHPDVVQAAVVGVPHEKMGEVLQAFVVPRPDSGLTPAALLQFARPRIADYKLPYGLGLLPELPLLSSGKPDRVALRELARGKPESSGAQPPRAEL